MLGGTVRTQEDVKRFTWVYIPFAGKYHANPQGLDASVPVGFDDERLDYFQKTLTSYVFISELLDYMPYYHNFHPRLYSKFIKKKKLKIFLKMPLSSRPTSSRHT